MEMTHYDRLGGEAGVRALVDSFYRLMDTLPEAAPIRAMHPKDLNGSKEKLFLFLTGWLGGPPLYTEKYGHPRLRARHLPFAIGEAERDQWILCMRRALEEIGVEEDLRKILDAALFRTADFMRNRPPAGGLAKQG